MHAVVKSLISRLHVYGGLAKAAVNCKVLYTVSYIFPQFQVLNL